MRRKSALRVRGVALCLAVLLAYYLLQRRRGPLQWINLVDTTVTELSKLTKSWTIIVYHMPLDVKLGGHIIIHGVLLEKKMFTWKIRQIPIEGHAVKQLARNHEKYLKGQKL